MKNLQKFNEKVQVDKVSKKDLLKDNILGK